MADVSAIFGILSMLGLAFPGMLITWWLLFPTAVEHARVRLDRTPWRCFWLGGVVTAFFSTPIGILAVLPAGPAQALAWVLVFAVLAMAGLGAAGIAATMGQRLRQQAGGDLSAWGAFLRGAVALELAAAFPVIGWFIFVPLAIVVSLGATVFAVLGWLPRPAAQPAAAVVALAENGLNDNDYKSHAFTA